MADTTTERKVQMPSPTDLYTIDHLLSEEERMVRDTVRKFVRERVLPVIGEHFEAGPFPPDLIPTIARLGLLGVEIEGDGCAALGCAGSGVACRAWGGGGSARPA